MSPAHSAGSFAQRFFVSTILLTLAARFSHTFCSLLAKRLEIPAFRVPTQYGMGDEALEVPGDYGQILAAK
jgi:hypothetical protein